MVGGSRSGRRRLLNRGRWRRRSRLRGRRSRRRRRRRRRCRRLTLRPRRRRRRGGSTDGCTVSRFRSGRGLGRPDLDSPGGVLHLAAQVDSLA
ncbi:hypothetical protein DQP56_00735 [Mycolicibacter senuensis]|nr:hypothetical protein DQP56_00735 [Mycolicibacter senuensis]